uniref:Uncharacterized protein n=1 Tax=Oryza punctata TaxID=4537 RepID=A0A0E0L0H0_ORYPU
MPSIFSFDTILYHPLQRRERRHSIASPGACTGNRRSDLDAVPTAVDRRKPSHRAINTALRNSALTREITVVFPGADHRRRHQFPSQPPPPPWIVATIAPPEVPIHRNLLGESPSTRKNHIHASNSPPLALPPASISVTAGDKMTTIGCVISRSTFSLLAATPNTPPSITGAVDKLAGRLHPASAAAGLSTESMIVYDMWGHDLNVNVEKSKGLLGVH